MEYLSFQLCNSSIGVSTEVMYNNAGQHRVCVINLNIQ